MISETGRWWGNNLKARRQEEIDIMSVMDKSAFFGECKWRREKVDISVIETLIDRGELFGYSEKYYYLFSKSGFQDDAIKYAEKNRNVKLITFDEMCSS